METALDLIGDMRDPAPPGPARWWLRPTAAASGGVPAPRRCSDTTRGLGAYGYL